MDNHTDISSNTIISKLPNKLKFWIILLRLDRPIGWWLLLLPSWWVILNEVNSLILSFKLISLFTIGSILMRGAGCIINDLWDKDIDSQVTRTKNRPIANGSITAKEALIGVLILLAISSILLLFLPFRSFLIAILSLPLIILYPLAKRYTKYPQFALGIVFSWGVPLGWSATNTDFNLEVVIMYLGTIAWVFGYDTIYSIQDKKDDMQLQVHSTSLTFKDNTKYAVSIAYFLCFILFININWSFLWIIGILLAGLHMIWQIKNLDLDSPSKALKLFKSNRDLGLIISLFAFLDLYFRV